MYTFFWSLVVLMVSLNAFSLELLSYKDTSTGIVKLADSAVEKVWSSSEPACLKDGPKLLGVNKAYREKNLGYRDCSNSDAANAKQKALGFKVTVIRLAELSDAKIKQVLGTK